MDILCVTKEAGCVNALEVLYILGNHQEQSNKLQLYCEGEPFLLYSNMK